MKAPDGVQDFLRDQGSNRFGEPQYRLVWGGDRLAVKIGEWHDFDPKLGLARRVVEARMAPKYPRATQRWHIETWIPPEVYGTMLQWATDTSEVAAGKLVKVLGDYPSRGDFVSIDVVEEVGICECGIPPSGWFWGFANRESLPPVGVPPGKPPRCGMCGMWSRYLTPTIAYCKYVVDAHRVALDRDIRTMNNNAAFEEAKKEQKSKEHYKAMAKDAMPAFLTRPTISLSGLDVPQQETHVSGG